MLTVNMLFPTWPSFDIDEQEAVSVVLASGKVNYWTGDKGRLFESKYAQFLDVKHSIALMNGTVALELALRGWGIGIGDEVIVTPRSFIASTSCVVVQGGKPVFADVDRNSGNLTAESIERVISPRTKAIVLVHLGGWPCEMDAIMELANSCGIRVIEDCAQAHGAVYRGKQVGAIGHAGAFSFCQDKIITTGGEGGLLVTNDEEMWVRAWAFKDHGKSYDAVHHREHASGFRWLCESFGTNWRMTELQAAIGNVQLGKLPAWNLRRRENAQVLIDGLKQIPGLRVPQVPVYITHAYYRFYAYLETDKLKASWNRERIVAEIAATGIPCFSGSCSEIYREKAFDGKSLRPPESLPIAKELGETSIAFLVHPTLELNHMEYVVRNVEHIMGNAVI